MHDCEFINKKDYVNVNFIYMYTNSNCHVLAIGFP